MHLHSFCFFICSEKSISFSHDLLNHIISSLFVKKILTNKKWLCTACLHIINIFSSTCRQLPVYSHKLVWRDVVKGDNDTKAHHTSAFCNRFVFRHIILHCFSTKNVYSSIQVQREQILPVAFDNMHYACQSAQVNTAGQLTRLHFQPALNEQLREQLYTDRQRRTILINSSSNLFSNNKSQC